MNMKRNRILLATFLVVALLVSISAHALIDVDAELGTDPIYTKLVNAGFFEKSVSNHMPEGASDVIYGYFGERLAQYGGLNYDSERLNTYINTGSYNKMQIPLMLMEAQIQISTASEERLKYNDYSYTVDYHTTSMASETELDVCLYLNYDVAYNGYPGVISSVTKEPHKLTLVKTDDEWQISSHEQFNDITMALENEVKSKRPLNDFLSMYIDRVTAQIKAFSASEPKNIEGEAPTRALKEYDRSDACRYARTYANSDNPSPWYTFTADCTNFVSIALRKGGLPQDTSGSNTWFWNSRTDRSGSWAGAKYLRPYLINNNSSSSSNAGAYAVSVDSEDDCSRGDVVSFASGSDISHNAILTSYSDGSGWLLCQHSYSENGKDVPLEDMLLDYSNGTVYFTHIKGYY